MPTFNPISHVCLLAHFAPSHSGVYIPSSKAHREDRQGETETRLSERSLRPSDVPRKQHCEGHEIDS